MIMMVCIPIIICAFLLLFKRQETSASRSLATFLFLCVFALCPQTIGFSGFYEVWPELTFFPFSVELWLGPLFYLHAFLLIKGGSLGKGNGFCSQACYKPAITAGLFWDICVMTPSQFKKSQQ